jgi:hypothetical protein
MTEDSDQPNTIFRCRKGPYSPIDFLNKSRICAHGLEHPAEDGNSVPEHNCDGCCYNESP